MENLQLSDHWHDLYVMLGTSSAALIGLLYIVTSLHLDEIVNNAVYRNRARSNSLYLIVTLVEAAVILTPQPVSFVGWELIPVNLFGLAVNIRNTYRFMIHPDVSRRGGMAMYRATTFMMGFLLAITGAVYLIAGSILGMYLVTASYVTLLVGVALNAWSIMLGVGQAEVSEKEQKRAVRKSRR